MTSRVAVAILHGAGIHTKTEVLDNMQQMETLLKAEFDRLSPGTESNSALAFELIYWDEESRLQERQNALQRIMRESGIKFGGWLTNLLSPRGVRGYVFDRIADVVGYQSRPDNADPQTSSADCEDTYCLIHRVVAQGLHELAQAAGESAPLFIVAHSLGTIISSNYIYDLQKDYMPPTADCTPEENQERPEDQRYTPRIFGDEMGQTPLERGETLTCFFTMGSPLALWSLQYETFDRPICVPARQLRQYHENVTGGWVNFYDQDDIIAYPLQPLYAHYLPRKDPRQIVRDQQVDVGSFPLDRTPFSHSGYWTDSDVIEPIARALADTSQAMNR